MDKFKLRQSVILFLTATIWGVAFVAQSVGMDYVGPFTFNGIRSVIGGIVLIPCIFIIRKIKGEENQVTGRTGEDKAKGRKLLIQGGVSCGVVLFIASSLQQIGIQYTTVGKAGFTTALYIVIVPLLSIFLHKKAGFKIWISVVIAVAGFYLLCISESFTLQTGDLLELLCAVSFSVHILVIDYFAPKVDGVKMSCIQFFVCGILGIIFMAIFEHPVISDILNAWQPILYAGVMSCGVAYTLQIIGQKGMNPAVASLIMSMESAISAVAAWIILDQKLSKKELCGCILVFAAIILAQLPDKKKKSETV